ncbi:MAG: hypothetical protein H6733_00455 [Alphaproteobacteria bacterium]|nr:hypothetical protein [Alphaproteobacteria bacterium]
MNRAVCIAVTWSLAAACTPSSAPPAADPSASLAAVAQAIAVRTRAEVDCTADDARFVCGMAQVPGDTFGLPTAPATWLGVSIAVRRSRAIGDGARETATVARLTVGPDGLYVESIRPTSPIESRALGAILGDASHALKGTRERIEVGQGMVDYLGQPPPAVWPLVQDDDGWRFEGDRPGRLYQVAADGDRPRALLVYEAGDRGTFVSLFPDVPWGVP